MANENVELMEDIYDEEDEDTQKDKYLTFQLSGEVYGLEIRHVTEVVGLQRITAVPDMPDFVKGVINLRGQVIPVIDVRARFKMEPKDYDDRTCVVVVNVADSAVGLVVDEVEEVLNVPESQVDPPPRVNCGTASSFIQGMGKVDEDVKILLDVNKLLQKEEIEQIAG